MKYQSLLAGKSKKNFINLSSAEFVHRKWLKKNSPKCHLLKLLPGMLSVKPLNTILDIISNPSAKRAKIPDNPSCLSCRVLWVIYR